MHSSAHRLVYSGVLAPRRDSCPGFGTPPAHIHTASPTDAPDSRIHTAHSGNFQEYIHHSTHSSPSKIPVISTSPLASTSALCCCLCVDKATNSTRRCSQRLPSHLNHLSGFIPGLVRQPTGDTDTLHDVSISFDKNAPSPAQLRHLHLQHGQQPISGSHSQSLLRHQSPTRQHIRALDARPPRADLQRASHRHCGTTKGL